MWSNVVTLFREYMGTGLIVILFLAALVYLFLKEKRKPMRIIFVYVPILLLLLFFNPLFAALVYDVAGDEIYYRILWLLPMTVVIAFTVVDIWGELQGRKKTVFALAAAGIVMVSGSFIYSNSFFSKAENLYHVPQSVVDICDVIEVEGREVKAVFPKELLQYVRQYSPVVCMPYGREVLVSRWSQGHELFDLMEQEEINAEELAAMCREYMTVYIVLPEDQKLGGRLEDYEFEWFAQMHGYVIYKDATVDLTAFMRELQGETE